MKSFIFAVLILITLFGVAYTSVAELYIWTTIAGFSGAFGRTDGPGSSALFGSPSGIVSDGQGHLFVTDFFNGSVRELTRRDNDWVVSTIATNMVQPQGITIDPSGNLYVADIETYQIWQLHPIGTNYSAQVIFGPVPGVGISWIAVDAATNLYVTCSLGYFIEGIVASPTNWVGTPIVGQAGSFASIDGTSADARFADPEGIFRDPSGNLFIAETWSETVREVSPVGTNWVVTTIAGTLKNFGSMDGMNGDAQFSAPTGVTMDSSGTLFVTDWGFGSVRKIRHEGTNWVVTTIAGPNDGNFKWPTGITIDPDGTLYVVDHEKNVIRKGVPFVPVLQCTRVGQQVQLSWSQLATNYVLETSTSLGPNASWTAIPDSPVAIGSNFQLRYPISEPTRFYRLRE